MTHTYIAYIDEAGDDGLSGKYREPGRGGSSHWLGIGATVWRASRDLEAVQWAKAIQANLGSQRKSKLLHFAEFDHSQRVMAVKALAGKPLRIVMAIIDKKRISRDSFPTKNALYFHLCCHLFERLSWLCRDLRPRAPEGDGSVKIVFARRGGMSYSDFRDYLGYLRKFPDPDIGIHWPVIDVENIEALDQSAKFGLQIADLAVSGVHAALEPDFYGNVEPRYASLLRANVFHRNWDFRSFGIKLLTDPRGWHEREQLADFVRLFEK